MLKVANLYKGINITGTSHSPQRYTNGPQNPLGSLSCQVRRWSKTSSSAQSKRKICKRVGRILKPQGGSLVFARQTDNLEGQEILRAKRALKMPL